MPRLSPLTPIFEVEKQIGSIDTGNMVPGSLVPSVGSVYTFTDNTNLDGVEDIAITDDTYAYVTARNQDRLTVIDISDPTNMSVHASVQDSTDMNAPTGIEKTGDYCYIGCDDGLGTGDLAIVDVSSPGSPSVVGNLGGLSDARYVTGKYGDHIINQERGTFREIRTINVSTPASPSVTGTLSSLTDSASEIVWDGGNYAYSITATASGGCRVINVTTLSSPSEGGYSGWGASGVSAGDAQFVGDTVFATGSTGTSGNRRLTAWDVTTRSSPATQQHVSLSGAHDPRGLIVEPDGAYAYVFTASGILYIVDSSDITNMSVIDTSGALDDSEPIVRAAMNASKTWVFGVVPSRDRIIAVKVRVA